MHSPIVVPIVQNVPLDDAFRVRRVGERGVGRGGERGGERGQGSRGAQDATDSATDSETDSATDSGPISVIWHHGPTT